MMICGQKFGEEIVSRICETVQGVADITRGRLSRLVCEWLDWRHRDGRLKEMSCRTALLKLEARGLIELPAAKPTTFTRRVERKATVWPTVTGSLAELGDVELLQIDSRDKELSSLWCEMMRAHHPLSDGPLCGAQLRYLVKSGAGFIGGLSFSAAAWRLKARDEWIGWDDAARGRGLEKIVGNSRFLLLPTVQVPNLASHVLGLAVRRLAADWHTRYGLSPVLLETFVDTTKYSGSCYRAANWRALGLTQGRGRQDRTYTANLAKKRIFVYPLQTDWQSVLCEGRAPARVPTPEKPRVEDWAATEFGGCLLGDLRLENRLQTMARDFFAQPVANLPQACGSRAKTKAAYRFLSHKDMNFRKLLQSHFVASEQRAAREAVVLAVQDTTSVNYTPLDDTEGLGPIGTTADGAQGLILHSTMAFNLEGTPLGLLDAQCWRRDAADFGKKTQRKKLPIEEKESRKWLDSYRAVGAVQSRCDQTRFVSVGDRESDIYELFYEATVVHPGGPALLIRAAQNRRVDTAQTYLWQTLESQPLAGVPVLQLPRTAKRVSREAPLEVRFARVVLRAPADKKTPDGQKLPDISLWAVLAKEKNTAVKEPVEWLLLTTLPVNTFDDALEKLQWYTRRWGIEVYHRTIKSGCRIEERQLCTADRLENCLAIDLVVAWRIDHLSKLARETPTASCEVCFEEAEWKAVMTYTSRDKPLPTEPPSLREIIRRIAALGGFLGRKCDKEPGTQTLWRGLHRLTDIAGMYRLMTCPSEDIDVPQVYVSSG